MSARRRSWSEEQDIKYASGVGPRIPPSQRPIRLLEWIVLGHAGIFLVWTTWAFGGGAEWMRPQFAWWGSLGLVLTVAALQDAEARKDGWMRPLVWLWPVVAFNVFVLIGCLNPSFREIKFGTETVLVNHGGIPWLPSCARPAVALPALCLFDAIWISCFNVALIVRERRALRGLLLVAVINALALAVFGTVQKLSHAKGIYFGEVTTRQPYFFASFIYHNHWGSFAVLMLAACLGLVWHVVRRSDARDFFHSPAFGGLVVVLLLAATVPLSTSRSCTVLVALLLGGALVHWIVWLLRRRRRKSVLLPLLGALAAIVLGATGVWFVARESITMRLAKTQEQLGEMRTRGSVGSRGELYRNTWSMAKDKLWFGWGMASYQHVFTRFYNTQNSVDRLPVFYRDAHSDWLQAIAEYGLVGSSLLALCAIVPVLRLRRRHFANPLPAYLLAGCALLLLYAWLEFPFGNVSVVLSWWLCFFCAVQTARLLDREAPTRDRSAA